MPDNKDKEVAQKWLRDNGKCASKSQNGHLCTITANHQDRPHKAQVLGGADDGLTLEEWPW